MRVSIEDLHYRIFHNERDILRANVKNSSDLYRLFRNIISIVYHGICAIPSFFDKHYYQKIVPSKYFFWGDFGNNYRALELIYEKMEFATIYKHGDLSFQRAWLYSLFFSPIVLFKYFRSLGYMKKTYANNFVSISYSYGCYIEIKKILKMSHPLMIIFANDRCYYQRALLRVAQEMGIKTVYTQHASIIDTYPPLEFNFAFLDGQESLDKYTANNKICKSDVFLYGSARFDIIKLLNMETAFLKNRYGIAINVFDCSDKITELICKLYQQFDNIEITIRAHPEMDKKFWKSFANKNNCYFSDAREENPFHFIAHNDFFIAGNTSFHLDVALTGKTSFYYNFSDRPIVDHYSYLKNGLIRILPNNFAQIKHYENDKCRTEIIQYYVANYATHNWGKSAELIASKLVELGNFK